MSKDKSEAKAEKWKNKAKSRQKENAKLRKRLAESNASRDNWKKKYQASKRSTGKGGAEKPRNHQFSLLVVSLCASLCRYGGMSLRCCEHCLRCVSAILGTRAPSHVSVRNWVLKCGHHALSSSGLARASGKWGLIVDESVTIGAERLLVVLGLELGNWKFRWPPRLEDVQVLHLEVRSEWKGEAVGEVLKGVISGREVVQGTSDAGRNLLSAFNLCELRRLPDCSHALAAILERHLGEDDLFKGLGTLVGQLRQHWATSQHAQWMPPKQRGKSRFMNVFPVVKWAEKIIAKERGLPPQVRERTGWLFQHRDFIRDLGLLRQMAAHLLSLLKRQGACKKSLDTAEAFLSQKMAGASELVQAVGKKIEECLQQLRAKIGDEDATYLCCSDIIESLFGKFKYALNPANPAKISERALIIPYFCGSLDNKQIKVALESVTNKQVKNWKKEMGNFASNPAKNHPKK